MTNRASACRAICVRLVSPGFEAVFTGEKSSPTIEEAEITDVVQPDIVVVLKENQIITTTELKGVPDLVIEILSPSSRKYDQELKKRLYEQHAAPEYWIVDPENQTVEQNVLGGNAKYSAANHQAQIQFQGRAATVDLQIVFTLPSPPRGRGGSGSYFLDDR